MRVFIFEHICGGGLSQIDLRPTLACKGGAMLAALVADFVQAGVEVTTSLDSRVDLSLPGAQVQRVAPGSDFTPVFDPLAKASDAALVVAPEFDRLLETWARRLENLGVRSLGCSPDGIALCGDKMVLARHLHRAAVATPVTTLGLPMGAPWDGDGAGGVTFPLVVKPRCGAGCEDTFICRRAADVAALPRRDDWITQRLVPGRAASCAFIVHGTTIRPLRAGEQFIDGDGRLIYRGGRMPLPLELEKRAIELGTKALREVPGLHGYVGVDLVLSDTADTVIEINPRPTVAFVGLRQLCRTSLAAAILNPAAPLAWDNRPLRYDAAGRMEWESQR